MSPNRQALLSLYHDDATALLARALQAQHEPEGLHVVHAALVEALADAHTDGREPSVSTTVPDETIEAIRARADHSAALPDVTDEHESPADCRRCHTSLHLLDGCEWPADGPLCGTCTDDERLEAIADRAALLAEVRRLTADRAITHEQAVQACANVGVDLTCGACAAVFYTGVGSPHDVHTCAGRDESDALRRSAEAAIRETGALRDGVTEAIGLAWRPIPQPFGATAYACPDDRDIIEAARTVVKERDEARAQVERLTDLVRHQRGPLHTEGLITDAEYAALAGLTGSPARLEGYDALRGELTITQRERNSLRPGHDSCARLATWISEHRESLDYTGCEMAGDAAIGLLTRILGERDEARTALAAARLDGARVMLREVEARAEGVAERHEGLAKAARAKDDRNRATAKQAAAEAVFGAIREIRAIDPAAVVGSGS